MSGPRGSTPSVIKTLLELIGVLILAGLLVAG
ncbi:MAG: hypothetical protein QOK11_2661, partial [Pseudonocardiales bacterium]|nr:hypothetical protein [Pseudonocardiales bacterium]